MSGCHSHSGASSNNDEGYTVTDPNHRVAEQLRRALQAQLADAGETADTRRRRTAARATLDANPELRRFPGSRPTAQRQRRHGDDG